MSAMVAEPPDRMSDLEAEVSRLREQVLDQGALLHRVMTDYAILRAVVEGDTASIVPQEATPPPGAHTRHLWALPSPA